MMDNAPYDYDMKNIDRGDDFSTVSSKSVSSARWHIPAWTRHLARRRDSPPPVTSLLSPQPCWPPSRKSRLGAQSDSLQDSYCDPIKATSVTSSSSKGGQSANIKPPPYVASEKAKQLDARCDVGIKPAGAKNDSQRPVEGAESSVYSYASRPTSYEAPRVIVEPCSSTTAE